MTETALQRDQAAERRAILQAFALNTIVAFALWIVSATSILIKRDIDGVQAPWLEPWVLEGTSPIVTVPLFFLVRWFEQKAPLGASSWRRALAVHTIGAVLLCTLVIAWMALFRGAVWPALFGTAYDLFGDRPFDVYLYEFRKVLPAYIGPLAAIYFFRQLETARLERDAALEEARRTHRLTLKCGGRTIFVEADGFLAAKAAGNYAEIKLTTGKQLARLTLADLERQLRDAGVDAVRVHRSWLVNRTVIAEVKPTGEGDVRITLTDGDTVPGSRRYREGLAA